MKNKIFSVLLIAIMLLQTAVFAKTFSDVEGHWAEPYVQKMTDTGLINGFDDGTFGPDYSVTRADALLLVSRVLGSTEKNISEFVDAAYGVYYKNVDDLGFAGYEKGLAYLLYNDVYTAKELRDFLGEGNGRNALKRYEAAILLVKLLGEEEAVLQNTMPILDFDDAGEIPAKAQAYVEFCATSGIMNGVGDNKFSPNTEVTRGQIAKMLCTAIEHLDITFVTGRVTGYDDKTKEVTYSGGADSDVTLEILPEYTLKKDGVDVIDTALIKIGDKINITCRGDEIVKIELLSVKEDVKTDGIFVKQTTGAEYTEVEIKADENATETETFKLFPECKITYAGVTTTLDAFPENCFVEYEVKDGFIVEISGKSGEIWREGIIEGFIYSTPSMLEISLEDGTREKYEFDSSLKVWREEEETTVNNLCIGDKVVVGVYFNKIRFLTAKGNAEEIDGTIKKIVISSSEPGITISTDTGDKAYNLSGDVSIISNDKPVTIYDLRIGYKVTLTVQGRSVTKLTVTQASVTEKFTLTGTVSGVDPTYKNVIIKGADGSENAVFVNETTVIIDSKSGQPVAFENIPTGATVISIVSPGKLNNTAISIAIITE